MNNDYHRLLDATISYLEQLKADGVDYVGVRTETLTALAQESQLNPSGGTAVSYDLSPPQTQPTANSGPAPTPHPSTPELLPQDIQERIPPPTSVSAPSPMDPKLKEAGMSELRARVLSCQICPHLAHSRKNVVFGVGNIHADVMFVGEAPGSDEDDQGEPFVGKAGQLLTRIIQTMGFRRDQVFIANILKCRPDTPGQTAGNRKPTSEEMQTCLPYLIKQIELIQPKIIVALGATAVEGLLGKTIGITKLRGHFQKFQGIPVMPTYHPAYLLRNQSLATKREVWEDMLKVLETLGIPITEKQRHYFLTA